jgi:hypothetical protein
LNLYISPCIYNALSYQCKLILYFLMKLYSKKKEDKMYIILLVMIGIELNSTSKSWFKGERIVQSYINSDTGFITSDVGFQVGFIIKSNLHMKIGNMLLCFAFATIWFICKPSNLRSIQIIFLQVLTLIDATFQFILSNHIIN